MFQIDSDHQDMQQLQMQLEQDCEVKPQVFGNPFDQSAWGLNPIDNHRFLPSFDHSTASLQAFRPDDADDLNMANGLSLWLKFTEQNTPLTVDTKVLTGGVKPQDVMPTQAQALPGIVPITPKMAEPFVYKAARKPSLTINSVKAQAIMSPADTFSTPPSATLSSFSTAYSSSVETPLDFDMNGCNLSPTPAGFGGDQIPKTVISRSTRACDTCRRRKLRCDVIIDNDGPGVESKAIIESCSRCKSSNSACQYTHVQKKRGPHSSSVSGETPSRARSSSKSSFGASPRSLAASFRAQTPTGSQPLRSTVSLPNVKSKPQRPVSMPPYTAAGPSFPHPFGTPVTAASVVRNRTVESSPRSSHRHISSRKHSITLQTEYEGNIEMRSQLDDYLKQHRGSESSPDYSHAVRAARRAAHRHSHSVGDAYRGQLASPFIPSPQLQAQQTIYKQDWVYPSPVPSSLILAQVLDMNKCGFSPDLGRHGSNIAMDPFERRKSLAGLQFIQNDPNRPAWYEQDV